MIDFRYHVVSIVAVFLALALGLFLGSTTLQGAVFSNLNHRVGNVTAQNQQLRNQRGVLQRQLTTDETFLRDLAPFAVHDALTDQTVAVVSTPGVDPGVTAAAASLLRQSGAEIAAQVQLQPMLLDPGQSSLLSSLADQLRPPQLKLPNGSAALRAGAELAGVMGERPDHSTITSGKEQSVLSAYRSAGALALNGALADVHPARLILLLTPPASAVPTSERDNDDATLLDIAKQYAGNAVGAVLAGPAPTSPGHDVLNLARATGSLPNNLATDDSIGTAGGQIAAIFALVAVFNGQNGAFGLKSQPPLPAAAGTP